MSEPKRYEPSTQCVEPSYQAQMIEPIVREVAWGNYVRYKDYDAMKADLKRLQARLDHMEATWPRDPHHGGKIYDMPVDPLMREAIDSAKLARKEGGAS